ncbi:hypothetical protein PIB30_037976 [Stylosanthes scabra]|uniref:Uncharacterized protein n=1 Tax=Stylosanthes scabra TaxID=79078 RepID=A0ABU6YEJ3_9FABA|nr:hypothetical protein [Stylosanthes scabra]
MEEANTEVAPRKRLIIKLRLPPSRTEECKLKHDDDFEKRGSESMASDSCGEKRKKDQCCNTTEEYSSNVSRTLSITAEWKVKKDDYAADSFREEKRRKIATCDLSVSRKAETEHPTKSCVQQHHNACPRIPITGSKELDSRNKNKEMEEEGVVYKKEEIVWRMAGPHEFSKDLRLLFSYGLMYPQRNDIHKVARKFSETFEINWKALKKKWLMKERERNRNLKRGRANNVIIKGRSRTLNKAT